MVQNLWQMVPLTCKCSEIATAHAGFFEVIVMVERLASLLQMLHSSGRVHRDLKPGARLFMPEHAQCISAANLPGMGISIARACAKTVRRPFARLSDRTGSCI